tara:strand:+ start:212 stop:886 length:675 start_codon:yes stop_codon:yes gene_type:complete
LVAKFLPSQSYGLDGLDLKLIEIVNRRNGYYVEIGANDGKAQSNTLALELLHGWHGILIEPIKETHRKLLKNRNNRRNRIVRSACVSFGFPSESLTLAVSNLMSTPLGVESDIVDPTKHATSGLKWVTPDNSAPSLIYEEVPARPMNKILTQAHAPQRMNLLSLDVEGAEIEVLKGIDFNFYRFDWILIECRNIVKMKRFMASKGYALHSKLSVHDYLFSDQQE